MYQFVVPTSFTGFGVRIGRELYKFDGQFFFLKLLLIIASTTHAYILRGLLALVQGYIGVPRGLVDLHRHRLRQDKNQRNRQVRKGVVPPQLRRAICTREIER